MSIGSSDSRRRAEWHTVRTVTGYCLAQFRHGTLPRRGQSIGSGGYSGKTQNDGDCLDHVACIPFVIFTLHEGMTMILFFPDTSSANLRKNKKNQQK